MIYNPLREQGRKDSHQNPSIENSIKGVHFDYYFTGRREGHSGQIELHLTSVVTDWQENVYIRKAWFIGYKRGWKNTVRDFLLEHMDDLNTGIQLIQALLRDFEIDNAKYVAWEKYEPVRYGMEG